jgi:peptidoglycan/xylan/chitin deacetylase (PgdA/CDA1 family)
MHLWFVLLPILMSQPAPVMAPPPAPSVAPPAPSPAPIAAPQTADGQDVDGNWAQGRQLLLTFDDGPDWENTPVLLDYLDDYGVKAVFFVNGRRFSGKLPLTLRNQAVLAELHRRGHVVGNHTMTHPMMAQIPPAVQRKEIERTHAAIKRVTGIDAWLYRSPFGGMTGASRAVLREMKYTIVMWNVDSNDPFERHANVSFRNVLRDLSIYGRGVALFHDTNSWSTEAVPRIIRAVWLENCHRAARGEPVVEFSNEIDAFWQHRSGKAPEPPLARLQEAARRRARMTAWCDGLRKGAQSP